MRGKHYKRKESRHSEIADIVKKITIATSASLLAKLIERLVDWLLKQ